MFQETLLDFLTAQLISHGAQLLVASMASLTFIGTFLGRTTENLRSAKTLFFIIAGGILSGACIYIFLRLLYYSCLLNTTVAYSFEAANKTYFKLFNEPLKETYLAYYQFISLQASNTSPFAQFYSLTQSWTLILFSILLVGPLINWLTWRIFKDQNKNRRKFQRDEGFVRKR